MPPWGRPLGAKGNKQRRRWEREQALWQQEQHRFQELDSDSDIQGVRVGFGGKRFTSDSLQFTGIDLSSKSRARRSYTFDELSSDSEGGYSNSEDGNESARQVALRDKEEALVQSALARIRRAQERGKSEVKLDPEELAALEKRRKRMQSSATSRKSKKDGASSGSSGGDRRRSDRAMITVPLIQPKPRRRNDGYLDQSPPRTSSGTPGIVVEGRDGTVSYAPIDHYPPSSNKGSPKQPHSLTSVQQYMPGGRHFSEESRPASSSNDARIPLPHEEDWTPVSRRSSVSSQNYSHDPFDYQISSDQTSPIPAQYLKSSNVGRRQVSSPSQVQYSSVKRSPPLRTPSIDRAPYHVPANSSEPILSRRRHGVTEPDDQYGGSSSEDREDSDGYTNGGTVELQRERIITTLPTRKPVGGARKKGKARRS